MDILGCFHQAAYICHQVTLPVRLPSGTGVWATMLHLMLVFYSMWLWHNFHVLIHMHHAPNAARECLQLAVHMCAAANYAMQSCCFQTSYILYK